MWKQFTTWLKSLIVRPMSVAFDVGISAAVGVVAYMLLGIIADAVPLGDALRPAVSGILAAMVYMRARTNLLDPTPAFKA